MTTEPTFRQYSVEEYIVTTEPFYEPVKDEIELFESAYAEKIPVLLKGPTGCGKTRFIEYMGTSGPAGERNARRGRKR